jgi:2-polyprenyl-6-methoxyphenol hydroxylase-like FAD-dependent oxidoreductase
MKSVAIIGSGPAGLFSALELLKNSKLDVTLFEKTLILQEEWLTIVN